MRYLDLCYVNPPPLPHIRDLPSIIDSEPIRSFKKLFLHNLPNLGVKDILLPLVDRDYRIYLKKELQFSLDKN